MKRALSLILALVLLIGMMPMTAFTTEETDATGIQNPLRAKKFPFSVPVLPLMRVFPTISPPIPPSATTMFTTLKAGMVFI